MTDYLYKQSGEPFGFRRGRFIFDMHGKAIGQIDRTHVHKLTGPYVGELEDDMVLDKGLGNFGNIGHPGNPGSAGAPGHPGNRGNRGSRGYRDVSGKLLE